MSEAALGALSVVALLGFWMRGAYRRLAGLRKAIGAAWKPFDAALGERAEALKALVGALRTPLASEHAALDAVMTAQGQGVAAAGALRGRALAPERARALGDAEAALASASARLLSLVELHPSALADSAVAGHIESLRDIGPRLDFARQVFNEAVQAYNDALRQFPTRLLARLLRLRVAAKI